MTEVNQELRAKQYFHGLIPREDVIDFLKKDGDFLLRVSEPVKGDEQQVVISVMVDKTRSAKEGISHYIIRQDNNGFHCERNHFPTIPALIDDLVTVGLLICFFY